MKKQLLAAAAVTTIGIAGVATAGVSHAITATTDTTTNPATSLAEAIAKKFNLKASDVETVINDQRNAMEQEYETKTKAEVAQLVKDGKLTQAQANAINTKRADLKKDHEANKPSANESKTDRKAAMEKRKADLDTWATKNNIPSEYLRYVMGGHGPRGGNIK